MSAALPAYDRSGTGEPLVLIHGLGADRHVWDPVTPQLSAHVDLVRVDLPGFGASAPLPAGAGEPTPARLAAAVADLMRVIGIDGGRAHVAGNSLGGWVALELAADGHAASVTAIAPAGLWSRTPAPKRQTARALARAVEPAAGPLMRLGTVRRAALCGAVAHPERMNAGDAAQMIRTYASAPGFTAVNRAMRAGRFQRMAAIDVPVTLVWAEHDRLIAPSPSVPDGVRQVSLAGCGHIPTYDDPAAVAQTILSTRATPAPRPVGS